jgi:hypothetical protein
MVELKAPGDSSLARRQQSEILSTSSQVSCLMNAIARFLMETGCHPFNPFDHVLGIRFSPSALVKAPTLAKFMLIVFKDKSNKWNLSKGRSLLSRAQG